jgi:hypothetical protein
MPSTLSSETRRAPTEHKNILNLQISVTAFGNITKILYQFIKNCASEGHLIQRVAANLLNKQLQTAEKGCPPAWRLGEVPTTHRKWDGWGM